MAILKNDHNILFKALIRGVGCFMLLLLGGCTSALPDEIQDLLTVRKENCWPCTGYKAVWEGLGSLTQSAFPTMCQIALNVLGLALLFWIAFTVGKFVVALKEPNIKDFITNIALILFKSIVVAIILLTPENTMYILELVIDPVVSGFVELSRNILFADSSIAKHFAAAASYKSIEKSSALFTSNVGNQLQDIVYRIYLGFSSGIGLGARMLISTDMLSWAMGIFIMFIFFYLMLIIPLIFMEGFIILGIVFVLFPFLLVSYVFPSTKSMLKVAWDALFIAISQMLITCIYLAVFVSVIQSRTNDFSIGKQLTDVKLLTGLKDMTTNGIAFFALIWCLFKMANDIPRMAAFLTGTQNRSQMMALVQRFTSIVTSAGKFVAGAALVGTGVGSGIGASMMHDGLHDAAKNVKEEFATGSQNNKTDTNNFKHSVVGKK